MDTNDGCKQKINFAGFDLLDSAQIQITSFGKHFLRHVSRGALTSDVCAE